MIGRFQRLGVVVLGAASLGFLDPWALARQGNRLYGDGRFDDAAAKYNEALVDHPDSPLLHFNLGDALYRQSKHEEALAAFTRVPTGDDDPARTARVAYNVGNTKYRLGEAAEASDPQKALGLYAEAIAAYRRALGVSPEDADAKFNHEFVEKKIADLRRKLEEQRKQQEEEEQQQQQHEQQQDQPPQSEGEQEQQPPEQQAEQEQPPPSPPQTEPNQSSAEQAPAGGAGDTPDAESKDGDMSRQEAAALLDAQRGEEVQPDEMAKRLHGAVEADPAQDW